MSDGLRAPVATWLAYGCDSPTSECSRFVSDFGFDMSRLLHFAIADTSPNCCNYVKDAISDLAQNVAMAKKAKAGKKKGVKHPPNFLVQWREYRKMTQEELAAAVKPPTNASVISLLETRDRGLSNKWLTRLAPVLGTKRGRILDMNPFEADSDVLEIWGIIPEEERPRVLTILATFTKKAGKSG